MRFRCRGSGFAVVALLALVQPLGAEDDGQHRRAPHRQSQERQVLSHRRLVSTYIPSNQIAMEPEKFHIVHGIVSFPVTNWSSIENTSHRMPHSRHASALCCFSSSIV